jgi:hypothetical protein
VGQEEVISVLQGQEQVQHEYRYLGQYQGQCLRLLELPPQQLLLLQAQLD